MSHPKGGYRGVFVVNDIPWGPNHPEYFDTAEEFFEAEPAADFGRWSAVPHWTVDEGIALSFGYDPRVADVNLLRNYEAHPFADEYDRRADLAARAVAAGQLSPLSSPKRYLKWAHGAGIDFPPTLVQMVKAAATAKRAKSTSSSPSGQKKQIKTLSRLALGMAKDLYGFDPANPREETFEEIVADLRGAGLPANIESVKGCLEPVDDLDDNLPDVRETLGKVVLGLAICNYGHDPKASRSDATSKIAETVQGSVTVDTIRHHLRQAAASYLAGT